MIRFEDIKDRVEAYHPEADFELLRRAYVFSAMKHQNQLRESGEPYLIHPLEVAYILAGLKLDLTTVAVGLLHDVLEDTLTTREVMEETFGGEITHLVEGLSKLSRFQFESAEQREAENFRKMMLAVVDDLRVIMVKLADRLHNMRTLEHLNPDRQKSIARETLEIYAPIANRLGLGAIKEELEDLTFRYLDETGYRNLERRLVERQSISDALIRDVQGTLQTHLRSAGFSVEIHGRVKRFHSISKKMREQQIDVDEVYDYVAFRIITDSVKSCYGILGIIHSLWRPVPGRIKDYIAMPKPNMYQSLHTSVMGDQGHPFEIQIRTREMDDIAERGIAAHWKYKEGTPLRAEDERNVEWLRQLIDWQQELEDPREFLKAVKIDLYPEEVYAFTPKGEVRSLPRGATPIDFAYKVHTEVGHHCHGARVNGRLVPLKTELKNGDVVEILTAPSAHPSRDWLSVVKTSMARSKIRHWIHKVEREESLGLGRTMMERELKRFQLSFKKLQGHPELPAMLKALGFPDLDDLLASVGFGRTLPGDVVERLFPERKAGPAVGSKLQAVKRVLGLGGDRVEVAGMRDGMVTLAKCCNPVRGEPIVGYVSRGRGVTVHLESCPNLEKLLCDPRRKIEVRWRSSKDEFYEVRVRIRSEDRKGFLALVTSTLAEEGANIKDIRAEATEDRRGNTDLTIHIRNHRQLGRILDRLRALDGVAAVERVLG
jgi:GTP diphosphokinase / guanosine-3',5'-bis(diphosphate) 3'-diphosphatase